MIEKIIELDRYLFLLINKESRNDLFDTIMPFIRQPLFWIPLYLFMLVFLFANFGKKGWRWFLFAIITVSSTDLISSKIIKPFFARPRPCMDPDFEVNVRLLLNYCGANGSFISSHAANHFGLSMFIFITCRHFAPKTGYLFFIWSAAICMAQVYVGVHYPGDVLGGAIFGILAGSITGKFYNKKTGLLLLGKTNK